MADTNDQERVLDKSAESKTGDSVVAHNEAASGMKELTNEAVAYNQARKAGARDKNTSEILGPQPQFFDSNTTHGGQSQDKEAADAQKQIQTDSDNSQSDRLKTISNTQDKIFQVQQDAIKEPKPSDKKFDEYIRPERTSD